ncbi:hypothetical protein HY844_00830 [Candidatus Berkelbacteria bacterium]|nr:hypothetical protein [Candidatus Berkelbacteria bacterium]
MKNKLAVILAILGTVILAVAPFTLEKYRPNTSANYVIKPITTTTFPDLIAPDFIQSTNSLSIDFNSYKSIEGAVTYISYSKQFSDLVNENENILTLSKVEKTNLINSLLSNTNLKDFESRQLIDGNYPKQTGGWWTTIGAATDRIKVELVQSNTGTFRGVRYFEQVGQDLGFTPSYKAVLINPEQNRIVVVTVDLTNLIEIKKYINPNTSDPLINQLNAYSALENFRSKPELNEFVSYLDALVKDTLVN